MDPDDDAFLEKVQRAVIGGHGGRLRQYFQAPGESRIQLKLRENEELERRFQFWRIYNLLQGVQRQGRALPLDLKIEGLESLPNSEMEIFTRTSVFRIRRFLETMLGFYTGQLDLSGRSEARFNSLLPRWKEFIADLTTLRAASTITNEVVMRFPDGTPILLSDGNTLVEYCYQLDSPTMLNRFQTKWWTDVDPTFWFSSIDLTRRLIESEMEPVFQKIYLINLPYELILYILECLEPDSLQRLASTCQSFRRAAVPYLYKTQEVIIPWKGSGEPMELFPVGGATTNIKETVLAGRAIAIERVNYLRTRPDIVPKVQHLKVASYLVERFRWSDLISGEQREAEFYGPIMWGVEEILRTMIELRSVTFIDLPLHSDLINTLLQLPNLRIMDISGCAIDIPDTLPQNSTITSVDLDISSEEATTNLQFLGSLIALRALKITIRSGVQGWLLEILQPRVNPFPTLERLTIQHMDTREVPDLLAWLEPSIVNLKLTHVNLSVIGGFSRQDVSNLLDRLHHAPLRNLQLDGVYTISPLVFEEIAIKLPQLEALTIIRRDNINQLDRKPAYWPLPSYEYAPSLAHFHHLRYFGWNFRIPQFDFYPSSMVCFEDDCWCEDHEDPERGPEEPSDWRHTVALFGSRCPNLQAVSFLSYSGAAQRDYELVHKAGGAKVVVEVKSGHREDEDVF